MSKYVRVMDGTKSNASGFEYKLNEVNIAKKWNPNTMEPDKMGGFNFGTEDKILRWLHRGDTIYDVDIPDDAEVILCDESKGVYRSNKIIVANPKKITDDLVMNLYKKTTLSNKILADCLVTLVWKDRIKISKYIINNRVNKNNVDEFYTEFMNYSSKNNFDNDELINKKSKEGGKMNNENRHNSTNINWYPGHMAKTRRLISEKYSLIDVVYELVDARIPYSSKIKDIYDLIRNKPKLMIMTKKDLCDLKVTQKWIQYYENLGTKVLLVDLNNDNDYKKIMEETYKLMNETQMKRENKGMKEKEIHALVVGIPNVGKSTLINKMANRRVADVGNNPGVTKQVKWLKTPYNISLLDTPGILWPKISEEKVALNLAAMTSIKQEILLIDEVAVYILKTLSEYYPEILKERYKVTSVEDIENAYETIGKNMGAMKNGEVDYDRVSTKILNDVKMEYIKGITFDR